MAALPLSVAALPFKAAASVAGLFGRLLRGGLDLNADGAAAVPRHGAHGGDAWDCARALQHPSEVASARRDRVSRPQ